MSTPFSSYYEGVRFLCQDTDPDVPNISDCSLDAAFRFVLNAGIIHGYAVGSDNESSVPYQSSYNGFWPGNCGCGWGWDSYAYMYGYGAYNWSYGNYYNQWWDQGFMFMMNYTPPAPNPASQELSPTGNQRAWERLMVECASWFVSGMVAQRFHTRSITEQIAAPANLLGRLEQYLYNLKNGGAQSSGRPLPLPLVAIGIRSFYSGLWSSYGSAGCGLGYNLWGGGGMAVY
jgi:hypothetical protein